MDASFKHDIYYLYQGYTNSGRQVARATKIVTVATNICESLVWYLRLVSLLAPRILRRLLDF